MRIRIIRTIILIALPITSGVYFLRTGIGKFDSYVHRNDWPQTGVKIISSEFQYIRPERGKMKISSQKY